MGYRVPNTYNRANQTQYNINQFSGIELLSPVESAALSAIYGIGIKAAEAKAIASARNDARYDIPSFIDNYSPDAQLNGTGGYSVSDRYDGKMSSSLLGMPVMCWIKFVGGTYIDLQGNTIEIPEVVFETIVLSVTVRKNIVRTPIQGRNSGDVSEMISLGNFDVDIRVVITSNAPVNSTITKRQMIGVYPRENMEAINKMLIAPIAIPVECWYLQQFGINHLVIADGTSVEQTEGEYETQRLIIPAYSDNPLIIKIAQ